jgi:hypothetical protein
VVFVWRSCAVNPARRLFGHPLTVARPSLLVPREEAAPPRRAVGGAPRLDRRRELAFLGLRDPRRRRHRGRPDPKKWAGILREGFTTADRYLLHISGDVSGPLRTVMVAMAAGGDTALKQDDTGGFGFGGIDIDI